MDLTAIPDNAFGLAAVAISAVVALVVGRDKIKTEPAPPANAMANGNGRNGITPAVDECIGRRIAEHEAQCHRIDEIRNEILINRQDAAASAEQLNQRIMALTKRVDDVLLALGKR